MKCRNKRKALPLVANKSTKRVLRYDPTRTGALRKSLQRELRKRFAKLKLAVVELILKEDAFGLNLRSYASSLTSNVFCPTGEGGGVDPTCSPGNVQLGYSNGEGGYTSVPDKASADRLIEAHRNAQKSFQEMGVSIAGLSDIKIVAETNADRAGAYATGQGFTHKHNEENQLALEKQYRSTLDERAIGVVPVFAMQSIEDMMIHEIGHNIGRNLSKKDQKEWEKLYEKHKGNVDNLPSFYAQENSSEMWAESVLAVVKGYKFGGTSKEYNRSDPEVENFVRKRLGLTANEYSPDQPRDEGGRWSAGSALGAVAGAGKAVVGKLSHIEHVVAEKLGAGLAKLPEPVQAVVTGTFKAAFSTWRVGQSLAERVAKERGLTEEQASSLRAVLSTTDLVAFKAAKGAALSGVPGAGLATTITGVVPVASAGYLAYSTARDPLATYRAASGMVKEGLGRIREKLRSKQTTAPRGSFKPSLEQIGNTFVTNLSQEELRDLANAVQLHHFEDWYVALLCAALDESEGDVYLSIQVANELYADNPSAVANVFCPTGEGGGVDPSCSPGGAGTDRVSTEEDYAKNGTKAKAFKNWFGDWENDPANASKVMDKQTGKPKETHGDPKPVFHGRVERFDAFDKTRAGAATGDAELLEAGIGFYFAEDKRIADRWAGKAGGGGDVLTAYLAIKNPFDFDQRVTAKDFEHFASVAERTLGTKVDVSLIRSAGEEIKTGDGPDRPNGQYLWEVVAKAARRKGGDGNLVLAHAGYDGITHMAGNDHGGVADDPRRAQFGRVWIAFEPNQIKAVKNKGTFDPKSNSILNSLTLNTRWQFRTDAEKVKEFQAWLKRQVDEDILREAEHDVWEAYVRQGYAKGAGRSYEDFKTRYPDFLQEDSVATKQGFLRASISRPESVNKVKLLAGRAMDDLEGVTAEMSTRMVRHLTNGLVQGKGPREIARELSDDIDGIGRGRAETIARTEIIRAHAEGQLQALEDMGVEEVGVMVEWSTAQDEAVCPLCSPLEGVVLKLEEAKGMLPRHPNCRCAWIPANVGEEQEGQQRGQKTVEKAVRRSQGAEGLEDEDGWGPGKAISKERSRSVLNHSIPVDRFSETLNAFCPTGPGGGVDPSCSSSHQGSSTQREYKSFDEMFGDDVKPSVPFSQRSSAQKPVIEKVSAKVEKKSKQDKSADKKVEIPRLLEIIGEVDKELGGYNHVKLTDLKGRFPGVSKEEFAGAIHRARTEGKITLSAGEGRSGISAADKNAAVYEVDPISGRKDVMLLYVSVKK